MDSVTLSSAATSKSPLLSPPPQIPLTHTPNVTGTCHQVQSCITTVTGSGWLSVCCKTAHWVQFQCEPQRGSLAAQIDD